MTFGERNWHLRRVAPERKQLIINLVNGFNYRALPYQQQRWLQHRRLVLHDGAVTDKGRVWASTLLAWEAELLAKGRWP